MLKLLSPERDKPSLVIHVPEENNMDCDDQITSPSQANFDNITQLPTPLINNGAFPSVSSPEEPHQPLTMKKLRTKKSLPEFNSERSISDYKPFGRKNSLIEEAKVNQRNISQPLPRPPGVGVGVNRHNHSSAPTSKIPSPPLPDEAHNRYLDLKYYSPRFNIYFKFNKIIGKGNFSDVILANDINNSNNHIAIKIIRVPVKNGTQIKNFKYFIKRELNILYHLDHPCIITLYDYSINLNIHQTQIETVNGVESESEQELDPQAETHDLSHPDDPELAKDVQALTNSNHQLLFLNYCVGGNLLEFLTRNYKVFNKSLIYWLIIEKIVGEFICAVHYLHSNDIIHRDIKLENVLLNYTITELMNSTPSTLHRPICCLTDFGLAKKLTTSNQILTTRCGSQDYISPELLMGLKYDGKLTDSWSIGVLVYCLLENRLPFDLPPPHYLAQAGISPSVIKRRMQKNSPAHRIAMIDWDWYQSNDLLNDSSLDPQSKSIITKLQDIVKTTLVRKEHRLSVSNMLNIDKFTWIKLKGFL